MEPWAKIQVQIQIQIQVQRLLWMWWVAGAAGRYSHQGILPGVQHLHLLSRVRRFSLQVMV